VENQPFSDGGGLSELDLQLGAHRDDLTKVGGVDHDLIQDRGDDAAVNDVFPALIPLGRCELGPDATLTHQLKVKLQAVSVSFAAHETHLIVVVLHEPFPALFH